MTYLMMTKYFNNAVALTRSRRAATDDDVTAK